MCATPIYCNVLLFLVLVPQRKLFCESHLPKNYLFSWRIAHININELVQIKLTTNINVFFIWKSKVIFQSKIEEEDYNFMNFEKLEML